MLPVPWTGGPRGPVWVRARSALRSPASPVLTVQLFFLSTGTPMVPSVAETAARSRCQAPLVTHRTPRTCRRDVATLAMLPTGNGVLFTPCPKSLQKHGRKHLGVREVHLWFAHQPGVFLMGAARIGGSRHRWERWVIAAHAPWLPLHVSLP